MLPRDSDDEVIYTTLAAKIRAKGLSSYNLRDTSIDPNAEFWKLSYRENGNLLALLADSGISYYDTNLYFNPPLFPVFLSFSHGLFNKDASYLALKRGVKNFRFRYEQLYLVFPNAVFSVLFLAAVFFFGKDFFGEKEGALAALCCAVSPVFLVVVFKTWSDMLAVALLAWSFLLWRKRDSTRFNVFLSAFLFGLAVLTRTASLFGVFIFFTRRWRQFSLWTLVVVIVTAPWFYAFYKNYGTPFYFPEAGQVKQNVDWFKFISRPWYFYVVDLLYMTPLFLPGLLAWEKKSRILVAWVLSFLLPLSVLIYTRKPLGLEDRYLLPCYPALAALAARGIEKLEGCLPRYLTVIFIAAACVWSLKTAFFLIISRESLVFVPY